MSGRLRVDFSEVLEVVNELEGRAASRINEGIDRAKTLREEALAASREEAEDLLALLAEKVLEGLGGFNGELDFDFHIIGTAKSKELGLEAVYQFPGDDGIVRVELKTSRTPAFSSAAKEGRYA